MAQIITNKLRAFKSLEITGKHFTPISNLEYTDVTLTTLKDVVVSLRGNFTAVGRLLDVNRATVAKIYNTNAINVVLVCDAGDGKVIYKLLK
jgi:DNA-binding protein Fis